MEQIGISVIIPVYNGEQYLRQCVDSVLNQTFREIEVICVDDGSTDGSLGILNEYARQDSRVTILQQRNLYAGAARNNGMSRAVGKYLMFLDADDFYEENFLQVMYETAEKYAADIVICNINYYDEATGSVTKRQLPEESIDEIQAQKVFNRHVIPDQLFQVANGWPWDKIYRSDFVRESVIEFASTRTANDGFFVITALAKAERIVKVMDYLIYYRTNNTSSLSNTREKSWHCGFEMLYDIQERLQREGIYEELERTFLVFALKYLVWSIDSVKSWTGKQKILQCIQTEWRERIGMDDKPQEYYSCYTSQYERYMEIKDCSFDEFVDGEINRRINLARQPLIKSLREKSWVFPYQKVPKACRIVLYGAGKMGQAYYEQVELTGYCEIVLWMDQKFATEQPSKDCGWIKELRTKKYDYIVIAIAQDRLVEDVIQQLRQWNVPGEKIISIKE